MSLKDKEWFLDKVKGPSDIYPVTIVRDRYNGVYSGFLYVAFYADINWLTSEDKGYNGDDVDCREWWIKAKKMHYLVRDTFIGGGINPTLALNDLFEKMQDFYKTTE